jgi:beta-glucosidase
MTNRSLATSAMSGAWCVVVLLATSAWLASACASAPVPVAEPNSPVEIAEPIATPTRAVVRDPVMEAFVDSVLRGLTLEEKLGQLAQYRGRGTPTGPAVPEGGEAEIRSGRVGSFLGVHGAAYTREMQRIAVEDSRAKIPLLFAHDVIHGFRTLFPVSLAEAASWDTAAVRRAARIAGIEAAVAGLHWTFAPMVDIARDARWGRIVEGAGEDPYLGSAMAVARVRGFQGNDLRDSLTILDGEALRRIRRGGGGTRLQHDGHVGAHAARDLPATVQGSSGCGRRVRDGRVQ